MITSDSYELDRFSSAMAIRQFRLSLGLSRRDFGELLGFSNVMNGGSKSPSAEIVVYRWENEICRVSPENVEKLIVLGNKHKWNFHRFAGLCAQFRLYGSINDHEVTRRHALVVSDLATDLGEILKIKNLPKVGLAAALHDIGKGWLPDGILAKPEKLSPAEYEKMQQHVNWSHIALQAIDEDVATWAKYHHERWAGAKAKGYLEGLEGDEIPYESRIISIADSWDAMTADRPYRKGMDYEMAWKQIEKGSGTEFDPEMVKAFDEVARKWEERRCKAVAKAA